MGQRVRGWAGSRWRALFRKELIQVSRDRRVMVALFVPPLVQLVLFGMILSTDVSNVSLGIVDESRTPASRELIAKLTESRSFQLAATYLSSTDLATAISRGKIAAGVVIPYTFARDLERRVPVTVQFLLNGTDANTATISRGYALGVMQSYVAGLGGGGAAPAGGAGTVRLRTSNLFNPGLEGTWFTVTGLFGLIVVMNSCVVSSTAMVKEREKGTIEQLLMSPASTTEIIIAKIAPLFVLLCLSSFLSIGTMRFVFHVPFEGSALLVATGAALCVLAGIGIGTMIATFTSSALQAQLTMSFIVPPLSILSGAMSPVEGIPPFLRPLSSLSPIFHIGRIARGALIRGSGLEALSVNLLALGICAVILVGLSVRRFRNQLS